MNSCHMKPKLVFFQYRYDENLPEFLLIHKRDHVKCLSEFFDVTVINEDCDYQQICDECLPDITLFESGIDNLTCYKPKITNTGANAHVPKLGLHNADAFSGARAGFLSDMDHWGIETFFTISTTAAEHTPEIASNLFVWPNFVDTEIYRDYGEWKSIPVLLTGNKISFYPWRQKIFRLASERFPSLSSPHPGYNPGPNTVQFMTGEKYARTINASSVVPACGTVAKEVVRKHFEIPACRACLVAERSPALEAAGFVDMQNCVFADEHDAVDKLNHLFRNPDELARVTDEGYRLVRSRHTIKQRNEILQWFNLHKSLRADQKIIQVKPFEPLITVSAAEASRHSHITCNGVHLMILHQANEKLHEGKYDGAEQLYSKCLNYLQWLPEAKFGLALCNLYKGNATKALSWIEPSISYVLMEYKAIDPDPVEWAYFIVCFLCLGKSAEALEYAAKFPSLHHPELERARWAARVLEGGGRTDAWPQEEPPKRRLSIHPRPGRSIEKWLEELCIMLRACGQVTLAGVLDNSLRQGNPPPSTLRWVAHGARERGASSEAAPHDNGRERDQSLPVGKNASGSFSRRMLYRQLKSTFRRLAARVLHGVEANCGYFLPYHLSEMRNDEFYRAIQEVVRDETVRSALLIGGAQGEGCTEAFLAGAVENENMPMVFCVSGPTRRFGNRWSSTESRAGVKRYQCSGNSSGNMNDELGNTIQAIKTQHHINSIDVVLVDSSRFKHRIDFGSDLLEYMIGARVVLLDDINGPFNFDNHHRLLRDPNYVLVAANPGLRNGYAIFRRKNTVDVSRQGVGSRYLASSCLSGVSTGMVG
jgi:hypothetical protein